MKNIVLIGYRATGKTTIGQLLAKKLGWKFVDTDELIEKQAGKTIAEIVKEGGWEYFRNLETKTIKALRNKTQLVIALGGGAILRAENIMALKPNGCFVWLKLEPEMIVKRLLQDSKTQSQRPSLTGQTVTDEVKTILKERLPLYREAADLEIDANQPPETIVNHILINLRSNKSHN